MLKKITILTLVILFVFTSISAVAVELDDFDKNLLIRVFKDVDNEDVEYMARLGLDSKDISLILYYYSNSDKKLDKMSLIDWLEIENESMNSTVILGCQQLFLMMNLFVFDIPIVRDIFHHLTLKNMIKNIKLMVVQK